MDRLDDKWIGLDWIRHSTRVLYLSILMYVVLARKLFLNGTVLKNLSYLILSYPPSLDFPTVWVNDSELIRSDSESSSDILGPLVKFF